MFLKQLCNIDAVSGNETAIRNFIKEKISHKCDDIKTDSIGNLIAFKKGKSSQKKVMISAHMDEVGFIIKDVTDKGFLEFDTVGGIDPRVIVSKSVRIGEKGVNGVIGAKAVHLLSKEERQKAVKIDSLFIDIGAKDKEKALEVVNLGDYAAFDTPYEEFGEERIKAKALDDRIGCSILMQLIETTPCYDTYFCFTTQEEVGLRGAKIAAAKINPDIALVIEATTCQDIKDIDAKDHVTTQGGGCAITIADRTTIVDKDLYEKLYNMAIENNIKVQYKRTMQGGNDAGAIHLSCGGVKTVSISVACRYLHSPVTVASKYDIEQTKALAKMFILKTDEII